MSYQIIGQPDGKLCIFSSVVDALIITDATDEEVLEYFVNIATDREKERVSKIIVDVRNGEPEKSYRQFTLTYDEAVEMDQ